MYSGSIRCAQWSWGNEHWENPLTANIVVDTISIHLGSALSRRWLESCHFSPLLWVGGVDARISSRTANETVINISQVLIEAESTYRQRELTPALFLPFTINPCKSKQFILNACNYHPICISSRSPPSSLRYQLCTTREAGCFTYLKPSCPYIL